MHATKLQTSGASRLHILTRCDKRTHALASASATSQSEYWAPRRSTARSTPEMVALVKIMGLVNDSLIAVDSPIITAVGLRNVCGFRVSTTSSYTAQQLHSTERARPNHRTRAPLKASGRLHRVPDVFYTLSGQRRLQWLSGI